MFYPAFAYLEILIFYSVLYLLPLLAMPLLNHPLQHLFFRVGCPQRLTHYLAQITKVRAICIKGRVSPYGK